MFIKLHEEIKGEKFPIIVNADKILNVRSVDPESEDDVNVTQITFFPMSRIYVCEDAETVLNLIS